MYFLPRNLRYLRLFLLGWQALPDRRFLFGHLDASRLSSDWGQIGQISRKGFAQALRSGVPCNSILDIQLLELNTILLVMIQLSFLSLQVASVM